MGIALPVLIDDLKLDLGDAQWANGIYSVVFAALLLTAGRLGDRLRRARVRHDRGAHPGLVDTQCGVHDLRMGVAGIVIFILWERHRGHNGRSAILDLSLFGVPTLTWGNLTALCVAIGEFGLLFVLPLSIVNAMGLTTLGAGFVLAAMGVGAFASGSAARHLSERMGAPNVVLLGLGIEVVGVTATALLLGAGRSPWVLALLLVVYGLGQGLASAQLTGTVLADIPTEQSGQGSATQSTVRQIGAALGTALIGAVLAAGLAQALPARLDTVATVPPAVAQQLAQSTELSAGGTIAPMRPG